jgi:hypothetical protein
MNRSKLQKIAFCTLTAGVLAASQNVLAHTRLQTSTVTEGKTVYNNATIGHGCAPAVAGAANSPVIANSMVFPDGTDSMVYKIIPAIPEVPAVPATDTTPEIPAIPAIPASRELAEGTIDDYIAWGGKISHIPSKDVFEKTAIEFGREGLAGANAVGNHSWKGALPGNNNVGLVPIKIGAAFINEASCANSVTFRVAIADICKITKVTGFNEHTVNFWTPVVDGSNFNGDPLNPHHYNSPATYKITRDLVAHPLDGACPNGGIDVEIDPSAAQLNHDLPIPGVWPKR